jgi:hypothetical protein
MKKILSVMTLTLFLPVAAIKTADDCSKSSDACKPSVRTVSPFIAEVQKAEKALEIKQGKSRQAELKMPAPAEASPAPPAAEGRKQGVLSKPAWLLAVFPFLAGL